MAAPSRIEIKTQNWGTVVATTQEVDPPEWATGKAYQVHTDTGVLLGTVVKAEGGWKSVPLYGNQAGARTRQETIELLVHTMLGHNERQAP